MTAEDRIYQFDGYCGQCTGSEKNFVAIGSWGLVHHVRETFLTKHALHCPMEMKISEVTTDLHDKGDDTIVTTT